MNNRRSLLLALGLLLVSVLIYQQWQLDYHTPKPVVTEQTVTQQAETPNSTTSAAAVDTQAKGRVITLKNDMFRLSVDTLGGDVIESNLLKYAAELDSAERFVLLQNKADKTYVAQSGLVGKNGIDSSAGRRLPSRR